MVIVKDSSDGGDRDVLHLVAQTDKQGQPSPAEIFEAAEHFGGRTPEGHIQSIRTVGTFQPDKAALAKMTAVPAFVCGESKFWDARST
jgi:hypothetical protein